MFQWLKRRLVAWANHYQRREIARLKQESQRLKEEIDQTTGKPLQLSEEQNRRLSEKSQGIDAATLREMSVFKPEDHNSSDHDTNSTENR
jgi:hypothetical protein